MHAHVCFPFVLAMLLPIHVPGPCQTARPPTQPKFTAPSSITNWRTLRNLAEDAEGGLGERGMRRILSVDKSFRSAQQACRVLR
jgi:hypothetical protein